MMAELGMPTEAREVARFYKGLVDGFVIDRCDADQAPEIEAIGMAVLVTDTVMNDLEDRITLARDCYKFAEELAA